MRSNGLSISNMVPALGLIAALFMLGCSRGEEGQSGAAAGTTTASAVTPDVLVKRFTDAIAKKYKFTAKAALEDLEQLDPSNAKLQEMTETLAALPDPEPEIALNLGNGIKLDLVLIQPGSFVMGSPKGDSYERPVELKEKADTNAVATKSAASAKNAPVYMQVQIRRPYYMGKFEVTQEQWDAVIRLSPLETMARGVLEQVRQAQIGNTDVVPAKTVEQFVYDQWKNMTSDVTKAAPPSVVMANTILQDWQAAMAASNDPISIDILKMAKRVAVQWQAIGVETLARATCEQVKAVMGDAPAAVTEEAITKLILDEWKPMMGADPIDLIAKAVADDLKTKMSPDYKITSSKAAHSIHLRWKAIMDASTPGSVPVDGLANMIIGIWNAEAEIVQAKSISRENARKAVEGAVAEQWKTKMPAEEIAKMAGTAVDQLKSAITAEIDPSQVDKAKKAVAEQWNNLAFNLPKDKARPTIDALTKPVEDQWKKIICAIPLDKISKAVIEKWRATPGADPVVEMGKIFAAEWKAKCGTDPKAVPFDDIEKAVARRWKSIMGSNPIDKTNSLVAESWLSLTSDNCTFRNPRLPVDTISWMDCQEFMKRLCYIMPAYEFRLPNEAEWEYACRAGTTTEYFFGDTPAKLGDYAWFDADSDEKSHPVGEKQPNAWGLYDMTGNIYEWTLSPFDYYGLEKDANGNVIPFTEGDGGKEALIIPHSMRGGWYGFGPEACSSAWRVGYSPKNRHFSFGCRVAVTVR